MRLWLGRPPKSCRSCSSASNRRAQLLWLAILGLLCPLQASAQKPTSSFTRIENLPSRLFYFDDTPVILYHDAVSRDTWRSPDEGKTWELAKDVTRGESWTIVEHPYDNRMAFIMSRDRKHYRTIDRGLTWQHFEAPLPVAVGVPALTFHSRQPEWILYTGQDCESDGGWLGKVCYDVSFVTRDAFSSDPKKMLEHTSKCIWAHSTLEAAADVPDEQIFCVAFEAPSDNASSGGMRSLKESRLYASTDFFDKDRRLIDLGIGKEARGLVGIGGIKKYLVVALRPPSAYNGGTDSDGADQMLMYVSKDATNWSRAMFPHGHGLKENAYTIVESTSHSILVDVLTDPSANSGTLFTSNSDGVFFVRSLENTNRNVNGIVDFEKLQNIEGVAIANTVANADEVKGGQQAKDIVSKITWDDGGHWQLIAAPKVDHKGKAFKCDVSNVELCSLHLHSVTAPHNFGRVFSSTAPGLVMGVGSVGDHLLDYDDCDTFLSTDAGVTWRMIDDGPHKYEFGDAGSILVLIEDDEATDHVKYSFDHGKTWEKLDFDVKIRAKLLTTVPDSTSLKFLVLGTLDKGAKSQDGNRHAIVYLDFATMNKRHCEESRGDFEKWYARAGGASAPDCLMGHKQWFQRRKADADCVVGEKFKDPVGTEENCPCTNDDYECDFNYVPDKKLCVLAAPEVIPPGQCQKDGDQFLGSSGYRKIPGNSCQPTPGLRKDEKVMKDCSEGKQAPGKVTHQRTDFDSLVLDQQYFADSHALLAYTLDQQVWQSDNEGFAWRKLALDGPILAMTMHAYARDHAYLITSSRKVHYTTNRGEQWATFEAPMEANGLGIPVLDFHPTRAEWLLWTGSKDCTSSVSTTCQAVAFMSKDNGRNWKQIEHYIRTCSWARDKKFKIDETMIFCESYRTKSGSQRAFEDNALELIAGRDFYNRKQKLFDSVVGFATFEEYMVVAEYIEATGALNLRVSLDGKTFAKAQFPPSMRLESQAYTVLESVTDAVFLHVTTHPTKGSEWGSLLKSNSNGTYFAMSLEYVNRNERGFADFEKAIGLDGIAVMNIVSNPEDASVTARKDLQTRITHNDGGRWKSIPPPARDSLNQPFACQGTKCSLHLHGYTERTDPRATYSSPTAVGLMVAVGNVGEKLGAYNDGDLFLTRDAGFTWQEVRKDAHLWEYGDQGSIIVIANDEQATDRISYTTDEGDSWQDYVFGEAIRVQSIMTVPSDTSRRFVLFGYSPKKQDVSVAIHLDFSKLSNVKCKLDLADPNADDFELWSPSENRQEECLFGRQTLYHRRIRGRSCYIGERLPEVHSIVRNCTCSEEDFECEFNHRRNAKGECELVEGAFALPSDPGTCGLYDQFWNERTAYRKIPYSSCQGGLQLDKGAQHTCPGHSRHGWFWWIFVVAICGLIAGLFGLWWMRRRAKGSIRLPEPGWDDSSATSMLASVPYHLLGVASAAFAWLQRLPMPKRLRPKRGYRLPHEDDDAQLLFDDEDMSVRADGLRRVCVASRRCLQTSAGASQRVHPLQPQDRPFKPPSLRPSSRLESARLPNGMRGHKQRWSTLTLIMLATVTGSSTYALALLSKSATNSKAVADELAMPNPTQAQFDAALEAAKNVVGHENCTTDQQELVAHGTSDWSYHMTRKVPGAVLYPNSTDDVVRIVKIAKLHGIPIVPFAGGTSLEGQFMAPQHGVPEDHKPETDEMKAGRSFTLDFANMTNILAVHAGDLDAVVQPGLTYDDLNEQLKDRQLFFPVDPGPGACIGGMIGTGCSGTNAVRYGTMRENVIAMKVVMADGQVVTTRSRARKSSAGPNLGQLFLGSEGTLGIVTEATLKLYPVMPTTVSVISFPSVRAAADAAAEMVGRGVGVACLELLDDVMMKAVNKANALDKTRRQWAETASLFIKFSGNEAQMNHDAKTTREIVKRHGSLQVTFAKDKTEADELWQSRKVALWSALSYLDDDKTRVWTTDVCVPITNLPALIEETQRDLESAGLIAPMVGHVGDGNFHALILFRNDDELKRTRAAVHRMVERAQTLDGTCTGEHSVGVGKREYLAAELGQPTVEVLRKLKQSLDPQGIFNPGKLYPGKDIKH